MDAKQNNRQQNYKELSVEELSKITGGKHHQKSWEERFWKSFMRTFG